MKRHEYTVYIARLAHVVLNGYRAGIGEAAVAWEDLPFEKQALIIAGVEWRLENRTAPVSAQHGQWLERMLDAGWRVGSEFNEANKLHPCARPWDALPESQQLKSHVFVALVNGVTSEEVFEVTDVSVKQKLPVIDTPQAAAERKQFAKKLLAYANRPSTDLIGDRPVYIAEDYAVTEDYIVERILQNWSMTREEFDRQIESRQSELLEQEIEKMKAEYEAQLRLAI
jgi:hypothetical protein